MIARRVMLVLGPAVLVAGTFLPWLRSGRIERSSYSAGNALRQAGQLPAAASVLFDVWPFLSLLCAIAAAAALLGRLAVTGAAGVVAAALAGSVAGVVLAKSSNSLVRPVFLGPILTLVGSLLILVTVLISLAGLRARRR